MLWLRKSIYQLHTTDNQTLTQENCIFDAQLYSRFKYGSGKIAAQYARELTTLLEPFFKPTQDWLVTSSAYRFVPTASASIVNFLLRYMRQYTDNKLVSSVNEIKIHRDILFASDYGNLKQTEREELMRQTPLFIDNQACRGKYLLVVDDLRVTGAHEKRLRELLYTTGAKAVYFVYVAEWKEQVEATIEHKLNHEWVKSVENLKYIIDNEEFKINARVCKFLLSYPSLPDLENFYRSLPASLLLEINNAIRGDGYDLMLAYREHYEVLLSAIKRLSI